MVKINFLKATPLKKVTEQKTDDTTQLSEQKESPKIEDEIQKTIEDEEPSQIIETMPTEEESEVVEREEIGPLQKKSFLDKKEDTEPTFESIEEEEFDFFPSKSKRMFIIIPLLIVFLAVFIFIFIQLNKRYHFTSVFKKSEQAEVRQPEPSSTEPAIAQPVLDMFQNNLGNNQFIVEKMQKIISLRSITLKYSLIVITPSEINLTIVADTREKIAQIKNNLTDALKDLTIRTISTKSKIINNKEMFFADLNTKIQPSSITAYSGEVTNLNKTSDFINELRNLTKSHKIELNDIKDGRTNDRDEFQESFYYLNMSGSRENISKFLSLITTTYPLLHINKLSVNPSNLVTYSDSYISLRLNISYYHPKKPI